MGFLMQSVLGSVAVHRVRGGAGSWRRACRQGAELPEEAELVGDGPAFGDLAAGYPDDADPVSYTHLTLPTILLV